MIRPLTKDDLPSLEEAIQQIPGLKREDLESYLTDDRLLLGIEESETILGFVALSLSFEEAEIDDIAILPSSQEKGYGTLLLNETLSLLQKRGITSVFLEVRSQNKKAISLYEKAGFVPYRVRKGYYLSPLDDAICYRKEMGS